MDSAIAKRATGGNIDEIAVLGDSDFAIYVGNGRPDGCGDIMQRNQKLAKRNVWRVFDIWTWQKKGCRTYQ